MPKSTRSRSPHSSVTNVRFRWVREREIDWPEDGLSNRDRAPKGTISPAVRERILLGSPTIVFESGGGRYTPVSGLPAVLRVARGDPSDEALIPCLVVSDDEWDLATWSTLTQWVLPWVQGRLTGREKRRVRKMLKARPDLADVIRPRPERERAKDVLQAAAQPAQSTVVSAATSPGAIRAFGPQRRENDKCAPARRQGRGHRTKPPVPAST